MKNCDCGRRWPCRAAGAALLFVLAALCPYPAAAVVNPTVKELAPMVAPVEASAEVGPNDARQLMQRLIKILSFINKSHISQGPQARDLVSNAFDYHHKDKMSSQRMLATSGAIVDAWEAARMMGLFDEEHNFQGLITKGRDAGKECVFEYIIPPGLAPEYSTDLANIRLVGPSDARRKRRSQEMTLKEKEYLVVLNDMKKEVMEGIAVELGRTSAEARAVWLREVEEAGDAFEDHPSLVIDGVMSSSPSSRNKECWEVTLELKNLSHHPTEVELMLHIFGISDAENEIFIMAEHKQTVELRKTHVWVKEFYTRPEETYVELVKQLDKYGHPDCRVSKKDQKIGPTIEIRGWVAEVRHHGEYVGRAASQSYLYRYLEEVSTLPRVSDVKPTKKKKKKKK